jgi:hypothetical protein
LVLPDDEEADAVRPTAVLLGVDLCLYENTSERFGAREVGDGRTVSDGGDEPVDGYEPIEDHP